MFIEISQLDQKIQNNIIDIDNDIESLEEELKILKLQREKEIEKFKKVEEIKKLYSEIIEEKEKEKEKEELAKIKVEVEDRCRKCDRKESCCACWN